MNEDNSAVSDNFKRYNVLWGRNSYLCYCKANVGGDRKPKNNFGLVIKIGDWQSHPPCPSSQRSTDAEKRKLIWMMLLQGLSQYCTWNLFFGSLKLQWQFYVGKMSSLMSELGAGKHSASHYLLYWMIQIWSWQCHHWLPWWLTRCI